MRVTVVGVGYVGLVTSACLAECGHELTGVEASEARLASLQVGRVPFFEPKLDDLVASNMATRRLQFTASGPEAVASANLVFIAVGTHDGSGGWQTAALSSCLTEVVPHIRDDAALVIRSTLPPDFIRRLPAIVGSLRREAGKAVIPVLLNPEFTREGSAVQDFMHPDRIVIGVVDDPIGHGVSLLRILYQFAEAPVLVLSAANAALAKLGSNLFLATKISFANELATLCDAFGGSVDAVVAAMAYDPRIGGSFLRAGVGFGGSCLPHQVTMTVAAADSVGVQTPLLAAVEAVNKGQPERFVERLMLMLSDSDGSRRVALLGLTFKPETDDLRDAPSLVIAGLLLSRGASVVAYDPMESARQQAAARVPGLEIVDSVYGALAGADAVALVTEWSEFGQIDWWRAREVMRGTLVVDGRNTLLPERLTAAGFTYTAFGRGLVAPGASVEGAPEAGAVETVPSQPELMPSLSFIPALSNE